MNTAARTDVWTRALDAEAATAAGLPPAFAGPAASADAATGPGFQSDAPTAAIPSSDAAREPALDMDPDATRLDTAARPQLPLDDSPAGPLSPGQPFGPRYHIVRLLGIGGMGAVYQAWDAELGVVVAVKVIRPEVAADPAAAAMLERRFKQELLLARQVTHKNVVRIYDLGEIDGIKFITMPFIEGEELASVIRRQEKLPIERIMKIARGIATGLEAAHSAGVVHRDLKPANIMVDKGDEALIMDFGIARSTGGPAPLTVEPAGPFRPTVFTAGQTMAGAVVGTVQYMAPEQARAEPVDQRADIYAFGLIVYDMLLHQRRARGADTAIAELNSRMRSSPPAPRSIDPSIPEPLDRIVAQCIEPDAAKRFQTTPQLVAALNRLDDRGQLLPVVRRVTWRLVAGVLVVFLALLGATWWFAQGPEVPIVREPVSVLIADFQNSTGDPAFDHTLEQTFRRALEGAGFISAYDRSRIRATLGVAPPEKLDEVAARQLAINQGLRVVLSGSIGRRGNGYELSVKASQALAGNEIATVNGRASNREQVLDAVTKLASTVRRALGDQTSDAGNLLALKSITTTSLEVASLYAGGIDAQSRSKFEEARQSFLKAVELDPNFGLGYQGLAAMSRNVGRLQDAEKYAREALNHVAAMTERERIVARGNYYSLVGDYQQCVKAYGEVLAQFPADTTAHNQRAVCFARLRNMREAMREMREAVRILPKRVVLRSNLALFAAYASDFETADQEVRALEEPDDQAIAALALSQLGRGLLPEAAETYKRLGTTGDWGASYAISGLADLALYEGRFSDAERILERAVAADVASKNVDGAAMKLVLLAYVHLMRAQKGPAVVAARKAVMNSNAVPIQFLAARVMVEAGAIAEARKLAAPLAAEVVAERQAFGKIIEGEIALKSGNAREAIKILTDANSILDTWLGHFDLGRAYLELGAFPQADGEFDTCIKRRGEVLSLLDEEPTFGYFPPVYYYQGRAREGMKAAGFADSYGEYLKIRGASTEDPLLPEVRRRAGS
jgi:eukaryotic-like serine/threonine-protein kinase